MERSDQKKTVIHEWEANYNATGRERLDGSTTELKGTRREADLIVRGLIALRAQVQLRRATGVREAEPEEDWNLGPNGEGKGLGAAPQEKELTQLIEQIDTANYVSEPEVEHI